ncbi:G patch domain-containing protein 2-like isoform X2 [Eucyclogobius newberryi]|uniref:G patch domain-containing protein 2-like isoform X2 n=1 Tax=Eucyclogobius newberryi TaxID=166745 RepID=UPI003B5C3568
MMDELVQDLVLALEQSSEQSKLGELWEEMVLSPLQQRRQVRRRRAHRRHRDSSLYHYWLEASESSMDEASRGYRRNPASVSVANCSDSDERSTSSRWHRMRRRPLRSRPASWPHYDSYPENTPGRPLRRKRKVKRMTSDVSSRTQSKLTSPNVDPRPALRMRHLSGSKNRSGGWVRAEQPTEGALLMGQERWKRKLSRASEHQDGAEEKMSDGETSSTCSSDPGLFTNDEGRQGDDEQSDWFVEGDCGVRSAVTSLRPSWDSDSQQSLKETCSSATFLHPAQASRRGYCSRLAGTASCSIRKERRRIPTKGGRIPMFVKRLRNLSEDRYQRGFWLSSFGSQEQSQLETLCPSPRPVDMVLESPHLRCPSSIRTNRQININPRIVCTEDMRRRRRTSSSVISACSLSHKDKQ